MVSVIIDNYNYGRFIEEAIDSVLAQTYKEYEIIIVDDGSTDCSREIIKRYEREYPNKIKSIFKKNGGQASCFNVAFQIAKGDILAFLDSDDKWFPEKLEKMIPYFDQWEVVGHNAEYSNGFISVQSNFMEDKMDMLLKTYGFSWTYRLATSQSMISRKAFEEVYPIPEERWRICADHFMLYVASYYHNIKYVQEKLSYYRIHPNNAFVGKRPIDDYKYEKMDLDCAQLINGREGIDKIPRFTTKNMMRMLCKYSEGFKIEVGGEYVMYGASGLAQEGARIWKKMGADILYYCDSDPYKWGTIFDEREVISPDELINRRDEYDKIIIGSHYFREIETTLQKYGLKRGEDYMYTEFLHLRPETLYKNHLV